MSDTDFTYAVARTRALEVHLFSASTIEQLLSCSSYEECLDFLLEKGWGDDDTPKNAEAILARERETRTAKDRRTQSRHTHVARTSDRKA